MDNLTNIYMLLNELFIKHLQKFIVRLEPSNRGKLKFGSDVVAEVEKLFAGQEKVPVLRNIEFCQTQHLNVSLNKFNQI